MNTSENRMIEENQKLMENKFYNDILPLNRSGWLTTEMFIKAVVDLLLEFIKETNNPNTKVINFHHPTELIAKLDLRIPINPTSLQKVIEDCKEVLKYQVRTGHPRFFNQLSTGLDLISMIGEWLTATVNTNMFTYEISPVFVLMEKEIIETMCEIVGWPPGKRDGIFSPGGAISNLYAVNAARHYMFPRCKAIGMVETPNLAMFTSEDSHYSIRGAAALVGIGVDNCFPIPVDEKGKMIPSKLEEEVILAKKNGYVPFFVCAVGGTTVYGAFDPINEIANICKKYRMWLHVDAAWGGGILLSKKHRHLANGIEKADSVTWNPHKLMGALLQCSACLICHEGLLFQCNQMCADYLFQQDKPYDVSYDSGDKAIQCGRHNDVFKLWIMWRAKGMNGFEQQVNRLMELAKYFTEKIKRTPGYELIMENPEFLNICFWYVPKNVRHLESTEKKARLDKVAPKIKAKMMSSGSTMVGYQPDKDKPNFFRMIISNPATTYEDLDFFIEEIIRLGESL
ncbi:Glutamate decarboxylase 1 [Trichinella nelsoni]|uniref:Glutamate decarboxylase 1 n=1 Tax=Trichinella nelsoni TaxID=6336 RepID=A0A0V0RXV6_9BILA|nr:Glutamate decarboxylase 1 [Trichinella nelsoni]